MVKRLQKKMMVPLMVVLVLLSFSVLILYQHGMGSSPEPEKPIKLKLTRLRDMVSQDALDNEHTEHSLHMAGQQRAKLNKKIQALAQWVEMQKQQSAFQQKSEQSAQADIQAIKEQLQRLKSVQQARTRGLAHSNSQVLPQVSEEIVETNFQPHRVSFFHDADQRYIPSGSFSRAVILGGLDAQAGVLSRANPRPVILKLTHAVELPNHKKIDLTGCFLTAAGVGDVSSERAYIRLERLSCAKKDTPVLDVPVYGTVFGPSGKDGVRGTVVWRERKLLQGAMLAGVFSGLASGVSQGFTTQTLTPVGETQHVMTSKLLQYGAAQGTTTALGRLADYRIKRAEQYQPVIQVNAGVPVDVVFLKGVKLTHESDNAQGTEQHIHSSLSTEHLPLLSSVEQLKEPS